MRAAIVHGPGRTPVHGELDEPTERDGFVVVRVVASALSNATRVRAAGSHYSSTGGFPLVPGIDGVGRTGSGERVGFLLPEAPFGGMAEKTLVREALCVPVPDDVGDVLAAAIINPGQSPIGALRSRAHLQPGEGVLVNGATGITGQVAVQVARHLGAGRVVATGRDRGALARLRELGADDVIDLGGDADAVQDAMAAHVVDGGVDVVLDYLSGPPTQALLGAIARSRRSTPIRYVVAGTSADTSTTVPTSVLAATPVVLMGYGIGSVRPPEIVQAAAEALRIAARANLRVDVTEVPLARVEEAWTAAHDRSRVVFTL